MFLKVAYARYRDEKVTFLLAGFNVAPEVRDHPQGQVLNGIVTFAFPDVSP
jgi:hypothetical protein